jgi:hypothetical protein
VPPPASIAKGIEYDFHHLTSCGSKTSPI